MKTNQKTLENHLGLEKKNVRKPRLRPKTTRKPSPPSAKATVSKRVLDASAARAGSSGVASSEMERGGFPFCWLFVGFLLFFLSVFCWFFVVFLLVFCWLFVVLFVFCWVFVVVFLVFVCFFVVFFVGFLLFFLFGFCLGFHGFPYFFCFFVEGKVPPLVCLAKMLERRLKRGVFG